MRRGGGVGDERGARHRAAVRGGDAAVARLPAPRLRPAARAPRARGPTPCAAHKAVLGVLFRAGQPSSLAGGVLRQQLPVVPERGRGGAALAVPGATAAATCTLHRARRGPTHHAHHIRGQIPRHSRIRATSFVFEFQCKQIRERSFPMFGAPWR